MGSDTLKPAGRFKAPSIPKLPVAAAAAKGGSPGLLKAGALGAVAAEGLTSRNTGDGTLTAARKRGLKTAPSKARAKPKASKAENATKADFGKSFKSARAQGSKEFMWKGKKYTTKRKDGK
jgi:hypothetical protein